MSLPDVVSREEWLRARKELLAKEKELTRARDALNAERRMLPMVEIDKDYVFDGPDGEATLLDLFDGRRQLILSHFMFDPTWEDGCPSCTAGADEMSPGLLAHLHARETSLAYVARAPLAKLERYKAKRGWTFPWYSSYGSDFNYDFHVTLDESVAPVGVQLPDAGRARAAGTASTSTATSRSSSPARATSCATASDVFHTYSTFAPRRRDDRRLLLLPRPDRARPPGGVGGAEGPRRRPARRHARLRDLGVRSRGPSGSAPGRAQRTARTTSSAATTRRASLRRWRARARRRSAIASAPSSSSTTGSWRPRPRSRHTASSSSARRRSRTSAP